MYQPKFTYTDNLVASLIKLENNKATLSTLDLTYNVKHKLATNAKSMDLFQMANMLGYNITIKEGEKLSNGVKIDGIDEGSFKFMQSFRNVLEFNRSTMVDSYSEVDYSVLHHLNRLLIGGWKESWEAKFRTGGDILDVKWDDFANLRDETIDNSKVEKEMFELMDWYKSAIPTLAPVVRLGILIYRLIEIYPFIAANKITIVSLADYVLLRHGLSSRSYMSVMKTFVQNSERLRESILISRKNFDLCYWLEVLVECLTRDISDVRESINDFIITEEKSKNQPFLDLNKRQLKVLRYLQSVPMVKREDYCHMMEVSTMTAFRDLNDLVRKKLLKVEGQGRGTKYRLSSM